MIAVFTVLIHVFLSVIKSDEVDQTPSGVTPLIADPVVWI